MGKAQGQNHVQLKVHVKLQPVYTELLFKTADKTSSGESRLLDPQLAKQNTGGISAPPWLSAACVQK